MNPIPPPTRVTTGNQGEVTDKIDPFFEDIVTYVKEHYETGPYRFEVKSGELAYQQDHVTDDRVTFLTFHDFVLASVFATRTDFNDIQYTFYRSLEGLEEYVAKKPISP